MAEKAEAKKEPIIIKKYANRRLYNTATSSYVTLDHLCQMVKEGADFVVYDAKTGDDITRPVLTQIIVEEESKGSNLLPIGFLRQLISFYGDNLQWMVPRYLDHSMEIFAKNQEQMRQYMQNALGGLFPFGNLEEMGKQNVALFERAMKMFTPFNLSQREQENSTDGNAGATDPDSLTELKRQVDMLQKQLDALTESKKRE